MGVDKKWHFKIMPTTAGRDGKRNCRKRRDEEMMLNNNLQMFLHGGAAAGVEGFSVGGC